jgi:hypothetical protein
VQAILQSLAKLAVISNLKPGKPVSLVAHGLTRTQENKLGSLPFPWKLLITQTGLSALRVI